MNFFLSGIDYKVASVDIRESAYWERERIAAALGELSGVRIAILSTCNRFEIYGTAGRARGADAAIGLLKERFPHIFNTAYTIRGIRSVRGHLVRLASGAESRIKGEREISSQLGAWASQKGFPKDLGPIVYEALLAAKEARAASGQNATARNIATLVYDEIVARHDSDDLLNIAVAGTGKVAELFAYHKPHGARLYFAAHKNILRAGELAGIAGGEALLLKDLPRILVRAEALISATSSPHRVFDKGYFSKIAALRDRQLYIYDIAVPRDVSPEVAGSNGIVLKNIDEVGSDVDIKSGRAPQPVGR